MLIYSSSKPNFLHNAGNGGIGSKSAFWAGIKTRHNDLSVACRGCTMKWGGPCWSRYRSLSFCRLRAIWGIRQPGNTIDRDQFDEELDYGTGGE